MRTAVFFFTVVFCKSQSSPSFKQRPLTEEYRRWN